MIKLCRFKVDHWYWCIIKCLLLLLKSAWTEKTVFWLHVIDELIMNSSSVHIFCLSVMKYNPVNVVISIFIKDMSEQAPFNLRQSKTGLWEMEIQRVQCPTVVFLGDNQSDDETPKMHVSTDFHLTEN